MTTSKQAEQQGRQAYRDCKPVVDNPYLGKSKHLAYCYRTGWIIEQTLANIQESLRCAQNSLESIIEDEE